MLGGTQIAEARLTDWCQLAQGLHARYHVEDFGAGARFLVAIGEVAAETIAPVWAALLTGDPDAQGRGESFEGNRLLKKEHVEQGTATRRLGFHLT